MCVEFAEFAYFHLNCAFFIHPLKLWVAVARNDFKMGQI